MAEAWKAKTKLADHIPAQMMTKRVEDIESLSGAERSRILFEWEDWEVRVGRDGPDVEVREGESVGRSRDVSVRGR